MLQESDDEFGNPSEDDQKTVRLNTLVPERLYICGTVSMHERGDESSRQLTISNFARPDFYNFLWEGLGQISPCSENEPELGLKTCLQAVIRYRACVGWHYLICISLRNNLGDMKVQRIYPRKTRLLWVLFGL